MQQLNTLGTKERYDETDRVTYEEVRWNANPVARSGFVATMEAIERFVLPHIKEKKVFLELGPGPGTWTTVMRKELPNTSMELVDISTEMLKAAQQNLGNDPLITFTESDFLEWTPIKEFDVFFSSRAVEYFPEKRPVVKKIAQALAVGGDAFIITKNPHYTRMKLLGKKQSAFHSGQVAPKELTTLFEEQGVRVCGVHPVFCVVPGLHSATLNAFASHFLHLLPWNQLTASITESYLLHAKKV